ncbi:SPOR domain-containing protein [Marivirga sp. S37H4]|uniref:SPOR domain-containing protein n=1 Tax=Marivirga aurantiaca TaxID=2802615 RepID=A0A934X1N4_9BACT|nr:SPOR domain-containing protein [Marivirga aurantiaca]MBK6266841.1 SPOR domain-containing protein [Marivirga aurantiaca]
MDKLRNFIGLVMLVIVVSACATTSKTSTASKSFSDDLSEFRPEVDTINMDESELSNQFRETKENISPENDVTSTINEKLEILAENNAETKYVNGYAIQIYSGSSSSDAYAARDTAMNLLPEIKTTVEYQQPVYKVRVGSFTERLEVQRTLLKLKPEFPGAISVPTRIRVN